MARITPRFLFSEAKNTKKPGQFIIHTLDPILIVGVAKCPNKDAGLMTHNGKYILFFQDGFEHSEEMEKITDAMFKWIEAQECIGAIKIDALK
jgi:hypothetical protein